MKYTKTFFKDWVRDNTSKITKICLEDLLDENFEESKNENSLRKNIIKQICSEFIKQKALKDNLSEWIGSNMAVRPRFELGVPLLTHLLSKQAD